MQTKHITGRAVGDLAALGRAINEIRCEQGISSAELARRIGIAHQRLQGIQAGHEDPGYKILRALASGLGIPSRVLMRRAQALEREHSE